MRYVTSSLSLCSDLIFVFFSHRRPFRIFQLAFLLPLHFSFWTVDCAGGRIFSVSQNSALLRLSNWATKIVKSPWAPDCPARTCVECPSVFIGLIKCLKYKRRIKVYSRSLLEMSKQIWPVIYWEITWVGPNGKCPRNAKLNFDIIG